MMKFLNHEQRYIEHNLEEDLFEKRLEESLKREEKLSPNTSKSSITVPLRKIRHCRSGWITTQMLQATYDGQNRIYHTF